jgi:hypothetical protein
MRSIAAVALGTVASAAFGGDPGASCRLNGLPVPGFAVTALGPGEFEALHAAVAPRGQTERWTQIPWQPDLETARRQAALERKPLLMWVMDGHPLGCT